MSKAKKTITILFAVILFIVSSFNMAPSCFAVSENALNPSDDDVCIKVGETKTFEVVVEYDGIYNIALTIWEQPENLDASVIDVSVKGTGVNEENKGIEIERCFIGIQAEDRENAFQKDSQGNEIVPDSSVVRGYYEVVLRPETLFADKFIAINLSAGKYEIIITSQRNDIIIHSAALVEESDVAPYEKADFSKSNGHFSKIIEGELYSSKSGSEIVPVYDRTSPSTSPASPSTIKLNYIGGSSWADVGEWIEWKVDVPFDGYYKIGMRYRQNINSGSITSRRLYIDGKVPFQEVDHIKFDYHSNWKTTVLGTDEEPYLFYLTAGEHTIRLECCLGALSSLLQDSQDIVSQLNEAYRKIVKLTGSTPDKYRDYGLKKLIPEVFDSFETQSELLKNINCRLEEIAGKRGSANTTIDNIVTQLDRFCTDNKKVQKELDSFKSNIGALATWIFELTEQPLDIDYLWIGSVNDEFGENKDNFFSKLWFEIESFIASFIQDYSSINSDTNTKQIEVWTLMGRDQANVLRDLIVSDFTPNTDIGVKIKLVQNSVIANNSSSQNQLMMSVMSGMGPDVAVSVPLSDPVNYGVRNAAIDLKCFSDYDDISKRFHSQSLVPYSYEDKAFALPETLNFPVMFYRKDILNELGIALPKTWDDVCKIAGSLQKNNMDIVIPANDTSGIFSSATMFIYQNGSSLYTEDGKYSLLNDRKTIDAFVRFTNLFTSYQLPVKYDLANRFRTGEVPIAVADYTFANQISVYAPEIRGQWDMTTVPGTEDENGNINNTVALSGTAAVMLSGVKDKDAAWEFLKWWTSEEIQTQFGRIIEERLGTAARYNTANIAAISRLPWSSEQYDTLKKQMEQIKAVPEVPGGYLTSRYIETAFRRVINQNEDPRDATDEFAILINDELEYKRKELKLHE